MTPSITFDFMRLAQRLDVSRETRENDDLALGAFKVLPNELISHIFKNLGPTSSLIHAAQTCRLFNRLAVDELRRCPPITLNTSSYSVPTPQYACSGGGGKGGGPDPFEKYKPCTGGGGGGSPDPFEKYKLELDISNKRFREDFEIPLRSFEVTESVSLVSLAKFPFPRIDMIFEPPLPISWWGRLKLALSSALSGLTARVSQVYHRIWRA